MKKEIMVEKIDKGTITVFQLLSTLAVGSFYYVWAVAASYYDGPLMLIFQPLIGGVFSAVAIAGLLVIGLPIRLISRVRRWWRVHWWIPFILGSVGFVMMWASSMPHFSEDFFDPELGATVRLLNPVLGVGGWLLTLFAVLHFYPPCMFSTGCCNE